MSLYFLSSLRTSCMEAYRVVCRSLMFTLPKLQQNWEKGRFMWCTAFEFRRMRLPVFLHQKRAWAMAVTLFTRRGDLVLFLVPRGIRKRENTKRESGRERETQKKKKRLEACCMVFHAYSVMLFWGYAAMVKYWVGGSPTRHGWWSCWCIL